MCNFFFLVAAKLGLVDVSWSEMAALVAGVQYGLSSHANFHENKSLIFVKLTDSAQRAIEDFLRNRVSKKIPSKKLCL